MKQIVLVALFVFTAANAIHDATQEKLVPAAVWACSALSCLIGIAILRIHTRWRQHRETQREQDIWEGRIS